MNPSLFVKSIAGVFSRSRAHEDLVATAKETRETTIHMLEQFVALLAGDSKLQPKQWASKWQANYARVVGSGSKPFYTHMLETLQANMGAMDQAEDILMKEVPRDADAEALDYRAANVVQYVAMVSFVSKYIRMLLLVLLEDVKNNGAPVSAGFQSGLTSHDVKWLNDHVSVFYNCMASLTKAAKNFKAAIKDIPDINVALSDYEVQRGVSGDKKLDPFAMGFVPILPTVIYHLRMAYTDWVLARYNAAKLERQRLEFLIQALRDAPEGSNPRLESLIEYNLNQLNKVKFKIKQVEDSVNER